MFKKKLKDSDHALKYVANTAKERGCRRIFSDQTLVVTIGCFHDEWIQIYETLYDAYQKGVDHYFLLIGYSVPEVS